MQNCFGGMGPMMLLWMLLGIVFGVGLIIWIIKQTKK
jgi:hypothetical protein